MDLDLIAKLPIVRQAIADSEAADDAAAAAARKVVLDNLAASELELRALDEMYAQCVAEAEPLKAKLAALASRRAGIEYQIQRVNSLCTEIDRDLHRNHGESMIRGALQFLRSRAAHLYGEAEYTKNLSQPAQNVFGAAMRKPDPAAQQKAMVLAQQAVEVERVLLAIKYLERAPISPNEMRRRIDAELRSVGLTVSEAGQVAAIRPVEMAA